MTISGVVLGVILGGLINLLCSKHYYQKASEGLKKEAEGLKNETEKVRKNTKMILDGMEIANWVTIIRDSQGEPLAFVIKINVHDAISTQGSLSAVLTQTKKGEGGEPNNP